MACAGEAPLGHAAALTLAGPLMRYCDFASTHAAHAYVEYQQYMVADADRDRRDLLEHLLAGGMPTRGPPLAAAQAHGIGAESRMLVAAAVTVDARADADAPHVGSAAIACAGLHDAKTLVVVRQTEIVAILVLGADADPCRLCDRVDALQRLLRSEGIALAMGVSTVATGVADLPRAYEEAHVALAGVGEDGGVAALARLTPFDYLALRADDTARRLVNPQLRAFLDEDRRRGRVDRDDPRGRRRRPQPAPGVRAPPGPPRTWPSTAAPDRGAHRTQPAADRRPRSWQSPWTTRSPPVSVGARGA